MDVSDFVVLAAYGTLILELVVFPIPSEASTYQLFFKAEGDGNDGHRDATASSEGPGADPRSSDALSQARSRSALIKFVRFFLPTAFGVLLFLIPLVALPWPKILDFLGPLPNWRIPVLGITLVVAGRLLTFLSVLQLRPSKKGGAGITRPRGFFAFSRNPGLVGMYSFYLGICFLFPCILLFLGFFPYVLNMHQRVLMEESYLLETLGSGYREYFDRVPRYLVF